MASETLQVSPPQTQTIKVPCLGLRLKWICNCPARTYPFQYHDIGSPTWIVMLPGLSDPDHIYVRSTSCHQFHNPFSDACPECTSIPSSAKFRSLEERASKDLAKNTPFILLSWDQLLYRARGKAQECRQLQKKQDTLLRNVSKFTRRISDYERLTFHIAVSDYKNVSHVLRIAIKNHSSPGAVLSQLQQAIMKEYKPHPGTDERALDLGYLVKAIGGPKLLFALNRALSLPSYRTIGRHRKVPQLLPSVLTPSSKDASTNLATFFSTKERPLCAPAGHSLLLDGVALEEKCRYLRSSDNVIGLCREHAGALDLHVQSPQSILAIEEAIHAEKPRAHYASEATVVAIAPFQSSNYSAIPFILSGSCKAETGGSMAKWVADIVHAWSDNPDAAPARGPIWSIATDGESTMRMCRFVLCMSHKLPSSDPLHPLLRNLPGLNLCTGEDGITMTCDPKHILKRFATLLRAREGILINKSVVNKNHLRSHLIRLPYVDPGSVEALIDPADKQNVPKAVTLIQSLDRLKSLDSTYYSPSEVNEYHSLIAVGEIFAAFMNPFTDVDMNLSDQLTSLSKYAHTAFIVYSKHSTDFMTSALYADSQAVVKDIYFCVAKQKILDAQANFYIIHCGTDRLEMDFCLARTQTHHRNFDILDLAGKLATSSLIDAIYARNPDLDAGSRRLKISGSVGVDHVNPKSWTGDVSVDKVSLQLCWEAGRKQAVELISSIYPADPLVDFNAIFNSTDCDLLQPTGAYVGFSNDIDFSILDDQPDSTASEPDDSTDDEIHQSHGDDADENLEALLPDSADEPIDGFESSPQDWLEVNGKRYLKGCLVSQHLKANRSKKVVERTLRVRGLTLDDLRKHPSETPLDPDGDNCQVGDLVATLVRTDFTVCLVILQVIGICKDRQTHHVVSIEKLHDPNKDYIVQGEVLQLIQSSADMWSWPSRDFLKVTKPKKSQHKKTAVRDFTLSISGPLCYRVNPQVHSVPHPHPFPNPLDTDSPIQESSTWVFYADDLENILQLAWTDFQARDPQDPAQEIQSLPQVWGSFPYTDNSGAAAFVVGSFRSEVPSTELDKKSKQRCPLCHEEKRLEELRGHVGLHILWHSLGVEEDLTMKIGDNPCGFCGNDLCNTRLETSARKRQISSNCRLRCQFKYGAAQKSTKHSPCTNVPINCPHCPDTVWKYNAVNHIVFKHKDLLNTTSIDPVFILDIQRGKDEELMMGIPDDLVTKYRSEHPQLFPREEDLTAIKERVQAARPPEKRRFSHVQIAPANKRSRR